MASIGKTALRHEASQLEVHRMNLENPKAHGDEPAEMAKDAFH
jgi:hypothetical protein